MSDLKLFQMQSGAMCELEPIPLPSKRGSKRSSRTNLDTLLGVRFLASEYATTHGGRMDTLGLDENGYPVIVEYKRTMSENVINQGLFYLDWLMDHRDTSSSWSGVPRQARGGRDRVERATADLHRRGLHQIRHPRGQSDGPQRRVPLPSVRRRPVSSTSSPPSRPRPCRYPPRRSAA